MTVLPPKVAQFEHSSLWIKQQILRFDISVAHTIGVNVG